MKISMLEWAENLQKMNDKQVQQFAKKKKIDLSLEEIKKLLDHPDYEVKEAMDELRAPIDALEMIVDKSVWPVPSYGELTFEV